MTTLAKIGYGDKYPYNTFEYIVMVLIMFSGMIFFSYVLEQFIYIIQKDPSPTQVLQIVDTQSETISLQNWLIQLQRYRENKPLPPSQSKSIMNHFHNYWKENRIAAVNSDEDFLNRLPLST